jgi:predicted ATPase
LNTPAERYEALTAAGAADERRGATPFVGREQQLTALAVALGEARDERTCRLVTVTGPPGIGKSRLVREFTATLSEEATVVVGRCLSYGEGITYRPLAEIVRQLGPDPATRLAELLEGDAQAEPVTRAVLGTVGLTETAGGSDDTFWAFRRLFEALARERALVAVFEDLHWAEPRLLDLLDSVTAFSSGAPIVLLCLARPELLERRPEWAVPGPDRIGLPLEPLSEDEARAMIVTLEPELDEGAFEQIVERAEGNPLFLEQLVAAVREGAEPKLPATVQALLAARIGQLAPAERSLLERASVEGRTFHRGAVAKQLRKAERAQIGSVLMSLVRKQLIRPSQPEFTGEDAFRFTHVLIRDAAYESLPQQVRAELHEQVAAWLDQKPESEDEIVGYHLEQAYRHREQLDRIDDHARQLAERAGELLAAAGHGAWVRGDVSATINLLSRARSLLPRGNPNRGVALVELGVALDLAGEYARRDQVAKEALEEARATGDPALEWRARLIRIRLIRGPKPTHSRAEIEAELEQAIAELEALADDAALATAWYHRGRLHFVSSRNRDAENAFAQALWHAERAQDERTTSNARGMLAAALCAGPTPFDEVTARLEELLAEARGKPSERWLALSQQAWAYAWTGRFEQARRLQVEARAILEELGGWGPLAGHVLPVQATIERVAGDLTAAERLLSEAVELASRQDDEQLLPMLSADLALTLCDQGRYEEAGRLALEAAEAAPDDDDSTRSTSERVQAMVLAHRGQLREAESLARDAVALASGGDDLIWAGETYLTLAEVLSRSGKDAEAAAEARRAVELSERKGAVALTERARRLLGRSPDEIVPEQDRPTVEATPASSTRPFVGRMQELHELRASLEEASSGHGSLVLVTGEPGIGKTRLMQEFAGMASASGWHVLVGRCWEEGGAPPYWPWIQVVRAAGGEFEELAEPSPDRLAAPGADPESVRFRLFDAVTRYLVETARARPLVIVLDDLHAADAPSLLLLSFLGGAIADSPLLVLGSYREGEKRLQELATLFGELVRVGRRISLRGLSTDEVEAYVARVAGDTSRPDAARLHEITGGNPFFLGEVMRLLSAGGLLGEATDAVGDPMLRVPEEVRSLIRRRVAGLSHEAISSLDVAAVIGREFDFHVLEHTSRLRPERLLDVVAEAVHTGIVLEGPAMGRYTFVHELVRETLYEDLAPSRRLELHLKIGRVLEELSRGDPDAPLSEIAHHLALAAPLGDVEEACDYLVRAGDRASGLLAYEEAAAHYGRALELFGTAEEPSAERRCELLLRLGDAQWRAGNAEAARSSFEQATEVARRLGAAEMLARAALGYVVALGGFLFLARFEVGTSGAGLLEEALAALPEEDSPVRAELLARLAMELLGPLQPVERRVEVSRNALEMARRVGDSAALVTALHARHWAFTTPGMQLERLTHTEEMLRVGRETANREMEFLAHNARFHCFLELCDGRAMDAELETLTEIADVIRQPEYLWHATCLRCIRATLDGRFDDAERLRGEALETARLRRSGYPAYVREYAQPFAIGWAQGRVQELRQLAERHGERYPWIGRWRNALAAAEAGDERAARAELERHAERDFTDLPQDGLWVLHICGLAQAAVLIRDLRRGKQLYELLLPHVELNAVALSQQPFGPVALRLGMLATMFGRWDEAEGHFETAVKRCEHLGARAIVARIFYEHARMMLARGAAGDQPRAASLLDDAAHLCEELGMPGLLERIAAEPRLMPEAPAARFRREGEFWTVAYAGETLRLRDVKGLRYLAFLLGSPGKEIHVLELAQAVEGVSGRVAPGPPEPVLDVQAKESYRRRLQELSEDLQEARDWHDLERIARIEAEIDAVTDELARAAGLGGRDRQLASPAERARVSVTKAIRSAIKAIERESPELGDHLSASIRTGRFCSYAPPGEEPPAWTF